MLQRTRAHLRRWGLGRTAQMAGYRVLKRLGLFLCWVNSRPLTEGGAGSADIRRVTRAQCLAASTNQQLQLSPDFINLAFDQGWMCHAALIDEAIVAYAWRATGWAPNNEFTRVKVPAGYSYGFKALTLPEYRGRGLYPQIALAETVSCRQAGLTHGVSFTELVNFASMTADRKFGNRRVGIAGYVRVGRRVRVFATRGVRDLGFSFVPISSRQIDK